MDYTKELITDCKKFCGEYNQKNKSEYLKKKISPKSKVNDGVMYYELGKAIRLEEQENIKLARTITLLSEVIHAADDLVDSPTDLKKRTEHVGTLLNYYGFLNKLSEKETVNVKIFEKGLGRIASFFKLEESYRKKKPTKKRVEKILNESNCDFHLYTDVFCSFLDNELEDHIEAAIKKYLIMDIVLDHFVDLKKDYESKSFNPLLWYQGYYSTHSCFECEISKETYGFFIDIAIDAGESASELVDQKNDVSKLVSYYIKGGLCGLLLFSKHDYFRGQPKIDELKKLILKPHPWEILEINNFVFE